MATDLRRPPMLATGDRVAVATLRPSTGWRWRGVDGPVTGRLLPFCLEVFVGFHGTDFWPDLDGALLALETSEEAPSPDAVARMLRPLGLTGELAGLAGLLVGRPGGMEVDGVLDRAGDDDYDYDTAILDVMAEFAPGVPVVTGLGWGHTDPQWTLPVGVDATLEPPDGVGGTGTILVRPGVRAT